MSSPPKPGIYTPIPTFFKRSDGHSIDYYTQVEHAKFLRKNGIEGLLVMGSTGEQSHLTRKERASVVKKLHDEIPGYTLLAGVVANALQDALDEIESLKNAGASYAVVLPSSYFGQDIKQGGIIEWYTKLADESTLPLLIYVFPGVSNGIHVDPDTLVELSKHANIVGTKISHGNVSHHALVGLHEDIISGKNKFNVFTGLGQLLLPVLTVGAKGTIDALSGAFPKLYVDIFKAYESGDYDKARLLQLAASRGEEIISKVGILGIKRAIYEQGFGETYLGRAPLSQDFPTGAWDAVVPYFEAAKAADTSSK
ncbi:hypothetical protein BN7_5104 [Wickerhamomyces ciferrii]|uniref:Uncharacterized protein n=1 Tax=Wickerhamomyces ciferrii (strain ATCC 14091 / BCRC 22168 / CBS 111 / JCM 3599 / NBRC 0793 / NRRL Y-1031 F-60-10) TaxID=1206466 RepID=K0KU19_WICCF|nr:uncharacterized protein BN7_5104 [Wickerhamomyces ciferrii]CCH45522.1 hypothetical protein BN7_5104 [Wickerhamomyces ciferrii]